MPEGAWPWERVGLLAEETKSEFGSAKGTWPVREWPAGVVRQGKLRLVEGVGSEREWPVEKVRPEKRDSVEGAWPGERVDLAERLRPEKVGPVEAEPERAWPEKGGWSQVGPAAGVWPEEDTAWEVWPVYQEWPEDSVECLWLRERVNFAETLPEKQGLVEGAWRVAEESTKKVWSRERGELEVGTKPQKPGWGTYSAEGVNLKERMEPENWPWERRLPQERMYPGV